MKIFRVAVLVLALAVPAVVRAVPNACGFLSNPPRHYAHVIWIWMENHSTDTIIGSPAAPFFNDLANSCGLATNYHNITHPSLPNYIGATSGLRLSALEPFFGDCDPTGDCTTTAPSIFSQVPSWKAYEESMTTNCEPMNDGQYAVRHNPPPYFTTLTGCSQFDVPYTELQTDLDNDTLPAFAFITPDICDDIHSCPVTAGDTWLSTEVPKILASNAYQSGQTVLFITFDEGSLGIFIGRDCANNTTQRSCDIPTIVVSPYTPTGVTSDRLFNHYSLLRTTEQLLGIRKHLGLARKARTMRRAFNL